jgi:hypothetical protein
LDAQPDQNESRSDNRANVDEDSAAVQLGNFTDPHLAGEYHDMSSELSGIVTRSEIEAYSAFVGADDAEKRYFAGD